MPLANAHIPIVGFAAHSGAGKTTLVLRVLPRLREAGLRVGVIKHAHHSFEVDQQGKDSYEIRKAGASQTMITSRGRWALMVERELAREPTLDETLLEVDQGALDLIVVEGFKREDLPKIEIFRPALDRPLLQPNDPNIIAIASDGPLNPRPPVPLLDLNDVDEIASYIIKAIVHDTPFVEEAKQVEKTN